MLKIIQRKHGLNALLTTVLWGLLGAPAGAQVMDIHPDGTTAIYKGPLIASPEGLRPLAPEIIVTSALPVRAAIDRAAVANLQAC